MIFQTQGVTDRRTDGASYRDARTHLKMMAGRQDGLVVGRLPGSRAGKQAWLVQAGLSEH